MMSRGFRRSGGVDQRADAAAESAFLIRRGHLRASRRLIPARPSDDDIVFAVY
jgi:hypothetical protein